MKKIISSLLFAFLALATFAQTQITTAGINLRQTPNGQVVSVIPKGAAVELSGDCDQGWCPVSYDGQEGYVSKAYLQDAKGQTIQTNANQPQSPVHYYTNSSGNTVQSPTKYNSVPAGASAQCADGTYSFSQHRRGTCSHHGGVVRWL